MRLLGLDISVSRTKAVTTAASVPSNLNPVDTRGGWWPIVRESFTGAWQRNIEINLESVLSYNAVFACISLISSDIGKLRQRLVQRTNEGIWEETDSAAFSPILRRPNHYQNHIQFKEWWITSKLINGNTYALKQRDNRGVVIALHLMDPTRSKPLITPSGEVYYQFHADNLAGLEEGIVVPASEVIHDRINCFFHPLVGLSPIFACGLAATQGYQIQSNSTRLFANAARPSGILTAPGAISDATATRLKEHWQTNFSGENYGKVAVLGDGLKWEAITLTPVEAQMIEQLKWTTETVCSVFHVPPFKVGLGAPTSAPSNAELLNQIYYSDCLQSHIEQYELCLDEGLGLTEPKDGKLLGVELDLDGLLRMDTATKIDSLVKGVGGAIFTPNEARRKLDLPGVKGGQTPYLQQQNYSLAALDERDRNDPFAKPEPAPALPAPDDEEDEDVDEDQEDEADDEETEDEEDKAWREKALSTLLEELAA